MRQLPGPIHVALLKIEKISAKEKEHLTARL